MEAQPEVNNINVEIKKESDEHTLVSDCNQILSVNAIKEEEYHQDCRWSEQMTIQSDFVNAEIKTEPEDDSYCWVQSVIAVPMKKEADLDIPECENNDGGQEIFTCYHCGQSRTSLEKLRHHIRKIHNFLFKSLPCQQNLLIGYKTVATTQPLYKKEEKKPKLKQNTFFHCPFCDYITKSSIRLRRHLFTHIEGENYSGILKTKKPYQCPFCEFSSLYPQEINLHSMTLHMKRYQCIHCSYSATRSQQLKRHIMSVHTKEKPHQCTHCNYSATRFSLLKQHIMPVHKKEKPR